jgi:hypothetical protein
MAKKKKKILTKEQKAWIASTFITFLSGVMGTLIPFLSTMSPETLTKGAGYAILFLSLRSGFKAINETYFAPKA